MLIRLDETRSKVVVIKEIKTYSGRKWKGLIWTFVDRDGDEFKGFTEDELIFGSKLWNWLYNLTGQDCTPGGDLSLKPYANKRCMIFLMGRNGNVSNIARIPPEGTTTRATAEEIETEEEQTKADTPKENTISQEVNDLFG